MYAGYSVTAARVLREDLVPVQIRVARNRYGKRKELLHERV